MSVLGIYQDEPYKIIHEGREITLRFSKTGPTTGRISWTLPKGAPGCSPDDLDYNGIVILGSTSAIKLPDDVPQDGIKYTGDPTLNVNLHAGDTIGDALVVAAIYNDKTTNFVDVSGLDANTPYSFGGYAVDNTLHYHGEGVYSYSLKYAISAKIDGTAAYQIINYGVQPTDATGLEPSGSYTVTVEINDRPPFNLTISGANALTYQDLMNTLNEYFATIDQPFMSDVPPNTGSIYYDAVNQKLYIWDGTQNILQSAIYYPANPSPPPTLDYWFDPSIDIIYKWDGGNWVEQDHIDQSVDPKDVSCNQYWHDGVNTYKYDGTTWILQNTYISTVNPSFPPTLPCRTIWFNPDTGIFQVWVPVTGTCVSGDPVAEGVWNVINVFEWSTDPSVIVADDYWFDTDSNLLYQANGNSAWESRYPVTVSSVAPVAPHNGDYWYAPNIKGLQVWDGSIMRWVILSVKAMDHNPATPPSGDLWWDGDVLYEWDVITSAYVEVNGFYDQVVDPSLPPVLLVGDVWVTYTDPDNPTLFTSILSVWDGMRFVSIEAILWPTDPRTLALGTIWHNPTTGQFYVLENTGWVELTAGGTAGHSLITFTSDPLTPSAGTFWVNTTTGAVYLWNGMAWVNLSPVLTSSPAPALGTLWYNTTTHKLMIWTGTSWIEQAPIASVVLDGDGNLLFTSSLVGCDSKMILTDAPNWNTPNGFLGIFNNTIPHGMVQEPILGSSANDGTPLTETLGVGTDGNPAHRRGMVENILMQLGYPTIQVELTKEQLEFCVDQGLQYLRRHSSAAYDRVLFFMWLEPGKQHYYLTNECVGFNKIVDVQMITRMSSSFLGQAEGQGVYGQVVLQHLYAMGTFDLVSYHIVSEYMELMEILFAARIVFTWNESKRLLSIHQRTTYPEKVLIDASIERTEQMLLQDRWCSNWIQTWATAEARQILAEIRGKFQTLPGAGGGVTLNSQALREKAKEEFQECMDELDNYIVNNAEDWGMGTQFVVG